MKKFGLLGKNISYTFSPILHNKIFELYNINAQYKIYDLQNENLIKEFLQNLKSENLLGINITTPYKTSVLKFVDILSPEVQSIGATNCIKFEKEKLVAYNTDYFGLIKTFEKMGLVLKNKKAVVLGTGGAAKACIRALLDSEAIVYVVSRDITKAEKELENVFFLSYDDLEKTSGYLIVNATPVGTTPNINASPVKKNVIQNFDFILDLIYNPKETLFLKYAKDLGKPFENGLYMLISQGIKSQEIWNESTFNYEQIYSELINLVYK